MRALSTLRKFGSCLLAAALVALCVPQLAEAQYYQGTPASGVSGVLSAVNGGTGKSNNAAATLTRVGNYGLTITLTGATNLTFPTSGTVLTTGGSGIPLTGLDTQAANTIVGNATSGAASPTALAIGSCSTSSSALLWTSNTGFGCNTSINAATLGGATFASPGAIGSSTPAAGSFTTGAFSSTLTLSGTAANIAAGANYINYDGTDDGLYFDSNNGVLILNSASTNGLTITRPGNVNHLRLTRTSSATADFRNYVNNNAWYVADMSGTGGSLALSAAGNLGIGGTISSNSRLYIYGISNTSSNFALEIDNGVGNALYKIREDGLVTYGLMSYAPYNYDVGAVRAMYMNSSGQMGYNSSTRESKTNIVELKNTDWLLQLHPVAFNYRERSEDGKYSNQAKTDLHYGLIADEVEKVNKDLVMYKTDGTLAGVRYDMLVTPTIAKIQEYSTRIRALEAANDSMFRRLQAAGIN